MNSGEISSLHQAYVDALKREGHFRSPRIEEAFRAVPRHLFVPGYPLEEVYNSELAIVRHAATTPVSASTRVRGAPGSPSRETNGTIAVSATAV